MTDEREDDRDAFDRPAVLQIAFGVQGFVLLLAMLMGWLFRQPVLGRFRWDGWDALLAVAATLPMLAGFLILYFWPPGPFKKIKQLLDEMLVPFLAPLTRTDLLALAILAGVGEEMLFRDVLQGMFEREGSVWQAVLWASVLFGVMHAITPTYAVMATVMGGYLGWLYVATDNLLVPIIVHALYDYVALLVLVRPARPNPMLSGEP